MNRREMLGGLCAATFGFKLSACENSTKPSATEIFPFALEDVPLPVKSLNRKQRYAKYKKMMCEDTDLSIKIGTIVQEAVNDAMPYCNFHVCSPYQMLDMAEELAIMGDLFVEKITHESNLLKVSKLPAFSMFRIETIKGELLEFQQSMDGPDYAAISRCRVEDSKNDLESCSIRFKPSEIDHIRIGSFLKLRGFYPYGISLIECKNVAESHYKKAFVETVKQWRWSDINNYKFLPI